MGTLIDIALESGYGTLHRQLTNQDLQKIRAEVHWVSAEEKTYLHGVRFLGMEARQSELIADLLCQYRLKQEGEPLAAS